MLSNGPRVGKWYKDVIAGSVFEVVAVDDKQRTIETQLLDGELAEYDMESWDELSAVEVEEPEDWRSPFSLSSEDAHFDDETLYPDDFADPLDRFEPEYINGLIDD